MTNEPTQKFDSDGNMTEWKQGDYEVIIERAPDGKIAFWTDSHGNSGTADTLPVPDESLIIIDFDSLPKKDYHIYIKHLDSPPENKVPVFKPEMEVKKEIPFIDPTKLYPNKYPVFDLAKLLAAHPSLAWCFDPNLMPPRNVPEAECPDCDKPLSQCTCPK